MKHWTISPFEAQSLVLRELNPTVEGRFFISKQSLIEIGIPNNGGKNFS
jgi:hypothetical protein